MSEYETVSGLLVELSEHINAFADRVHEFDKTQTVIQRAVNNLDRFMLSMSASHSILPISKESLSPKIESEPQPTTIKEIDVGKSSKQSINGISNSESSGDVSVSKVPKSGSTKRSRETVFSLERQQGNVPKRLKNSKDIAAMERILQFIASKKKEGVVLKEVVVLVNESTIRCNEYLNALIKMEEIVRTQTKKGLVYTLHPNRYFKYLNN